MQRNGPSSEADRAKESYPRSDQDYGLSWIRRDGKGRVFYTALGDPEHAWRDARYQTHLIEGVKWTMGKLP